MITGALSNVLDFGADSTGASSSTAAFVLANSAASGVVIPKGTYLLSTSVTFTVPVTVEFGAVITVPNGVTLAFNKGFNAGVYQCFNTTGTGLVTFSPQYTAEGYAEWWGAAGGGTDCGPAINKAIVALLKVQLMGAEYFCSETIKMQLPHRELCGVGFAFADTVDQMSRIVVIGGSLDVMQIGPDTEPPGGINDFQQQNAVRNLYLSRSDDPVISSVCSGMTVQYTLSAQIENVKSAGHIYGFEFYGTVYTIVTNCQSVRAQAGTGGGTDLWYGYYINGFPDIGAAGGNASLYLNYCTAGCNVESLQYSGSTGFYADGAFTDVFLESPETVSCTTSFSIIGNASTSLPASNTDFSIKNPISDAFKDFGIYIRDVNKFGSISITNPYFGPSAPIPATGYLGSTACVYIQDSNGSVRIDGGQFVMVGATNCFGITLDTVSNAIIDLPQILESSTSGVNATDAVSCYIAPFCKNYQNRLANAAVQFSSGCNANYVAPFANGVSLTTQAIVALGVQLIGTTNGRNEINCTGINSSALSASSDKLQINSVSVTATGLSGTNLVSGVMT
jgi:hypothetical protein